ncbi:hypothetical protein DPMN_110916 [Dreissena polymorpha]|uniref:Uncharacterized protein n=1 Tax=Dreissena polymorpha TaxID=45954 RepID=A0A9D4QNI4_DREPO|nr:hypothetical protein DPMN_110916 [Dreissena polymorpha]
MRVTLRRHPLTTSTTMWIRSGWTLRRTTTRTRDHPGRRPEPPPRDHVIARVWKQTRKSRS